MANIIILEPDLKLAHQQLKLFEELSGSHNVAHVNSLETLEKEYFTSDDEDQRSASSIDLIIARADMSPEDTPPLKWVLELNKKCNEFGYLQNNNNLKIIFTKYEDDGIDINSLIHPMVYDIFFVPFDKLLYLQKIQLILAMPKKTTPTYLFSQKVKESIEISKRSFVERVSNTGFTLKNPLQIADGTLTKLYLRISKSETIGVHARVVRSVALDGDQKGFLLDFIFYGLKRNDFKEINNFLRNNKHSKDFLDTDSSNFIKNDQSSADLSQLEKSIKHILIIDDEQRAQSLASNIEESISFVETDTVESMGEFNDKYLTDSVAKPTALSTQEDIPTGSLSFEVNTSDQTLVKVITELKSSTHFLQFKPNQFFKTSTDWNKIFNTEEAKTALQEASAVTDPNQKIKKITKLDTADHESRDVVIEFLQAAESITRINIKPMMKVAIDAPKKKKAKDAILKKVDLIVINLRFVPEDEAAWITKVKNGMIKNGLNKDGNSLSVIIISPDMDEKMIFNNQPKLLKHKNLFNYFYGPAPQNLLMSSIALATQRSHTKYSLDNISWLEKRTTCYIAKAATLNSVSEFGASITSKHPVQPGAVLYMHKYIFDQAPEGVLPSRFYFYAEDKKAPGSKDKKVTYTSHFTYFGINDAFLKYARKWIKDNYASQKDGEQ